MLANYAPHFDAARLAGQIPTDGQLPIDVDVAAKYLGIGVSSRLMTSNLEGLTVGAHRVVLSADLSTRRRRFVLAHEIAHALVRQGRLLVSASDEELFADQFALELLLPHYLDYANTSIESIQQTNDVEARVAAWRLTSLGYLPSIVTLKAGDVVCQRCGIRRNPRPCACTIERDKRHVQSRN